MENGSLTCQTGTRTLQIDIDRKASGTSTLLTGQWDLNDQLDGSGLNEEKEYNPCNNMTDYQSN